MRTTTYILLLLLLCGSAYAACGPELILNGGFTGNASNWTDFDTGLPINDTFTASCNYDNNNIHCDAPGTYAGIAQVVGNFAAPAAGNYTVGFDITGNGTVEFGIGNGGNFYHIGPDDGYFPDIDLNITDFSTTTRIKYLNEYLGGGAGFFVQPSENSSYNFTIDNISVKLGYCVHIPPIFNMTIYDLDHNLLNNETFTIMTDGPEFTYVNTTSNGTLNLEELPQGNYTVRIFNENYTMVTFQFPAMNDTTYILDAYMTYNNNTVTFNVVDNTDEHPIEDASTYAYRTIAGNVTLTEIKETDLAGNVIFNYALNTRYQYTINATGYMSKTFVLNPITQSAYTIRLIRSGTTYLPTLTGVIAHNTTTNNSQYNYTDSERTASRGCLRTYLATSGARTLLNTSCKTGWNGTVNANLNASSGNLYLLVGVIEKGGVNYTVNSLYVSYGTPSTAADDDGVLYLVIVTLILAFAALWSVRAAVILCSVTPFIFSLLGFVKWGPGETAVIAVLGLFVAYVIGD